MLSVSVFDVTNRARQTLNKGGDTIVAFTAQTGWPVYGRAGADFRFPLFIHFGQVAGENEGGTRTIGAADHGDVLRRQLQARVELSDRFVIPFFNFTQVDITEGFAVQHQFARFHARQVNRQYHAANHGGELEQTFLSQFVISQRSIRSTEINGVGNNLLNATRGTNTLVIHFIAGFFLIGISPFGIHRRRESCACASQACCCEGRESAHR